jgi:hypothetical protein
VPLRDLAEFREVHPFEWEVEGLKLWLESPALDVDRCRDRVPAQEILDVVCQWPLDEENRIVGHCIVDRPKERLEPPNVAGPLQPLLVKIATSAPTEPMATPQSPASPGSAHDGSLGR